MATEVERMYATLEMSDAKFAATLKRIEKSMKGLSSSADGELSKVRAAAYKTRAVLDKTLGASRLGQTGIGGLKTAVSAFIGAASIQGLKDFVDGIGDIADTADKIGVTTDALQELQHILQQNGGSAEEASEGLLKFAKNLAEARTGGGDLAGIFKENGVGITDDTMQMLQRYADLVRNAANEQDQLALANAAFGRGAAGGFVATLRQGGDALARMREEAGRLSIDEDLVRKADAIGDGLKQATEEIRSQLAPAAIDLYSVLADLAAPISKMVGLLTDAYFLVKSINDFTARAMNLGSLTTSVTLTDKKLSDLRSNLRDTEEELGRVAEEAKSSTVGQAGLLVDAATVRLDGLTQQRDQLRQEIGALEGKRSVMIAAPAGGGPPAGHGRTTPLALPPESVPTTRLPSSGGGGSAASKAGAPRSPAKDASPDEYARETKAIQDKIAALQDEAATLGMTTAAAEEYRARQELIRAATEAGVNLTPQQTAQLDALAASYGRLAGSVEDARRKIEATQEAQRAAADEAESAVEGLIVDGKNLNAVFADILKNVARMLIQSAIAGTGPLAGLLGTANPAGGAGGLIGGLFGGFRAAGGPVTAGRAYMTGERGPEMFVPRMSGTILSNGALQAAGRGGLSSTALHVTINAPGADAATLESVRRDVISLKKSIPSIAVQAVSRHERARRGF